MTHTTTSAELCCSISKDKGDLVSPLKGTVIIPPARLTSHWDGALRSRLNGLPLERFLRNHAQVCSGAAPHPLIERIEVACLFILNPELPHQVDWRALCNRDYFTALGRVMAAITCGLAHVVQEPQLWRVATLRAMARLLTPNLGIDMAASVAAAAMSSSAERNGEWAGESKLKTLTVAALMTESPSKLAELRERVCAHLEGAARGGATNILAAPRMLKIWVGPPSNH